jgi:hypothetical protein
MEKVKEPEVLAVDIPVAGAMAGMSPQRSYAAAREGIIPVVMVGKSRRKVPLARWRAILNGDAATA